VSVINVFLRGIVLLTKEFKKVLYDASAGSGKTTTIVSNVVKHIEEGVDPKSIVVITFTKSAARELRARVLKELKNKSEGLRFLHISTIDSFFIRILKENIDFTGLNFNFKVLDETRKVFIINSIIDSLYKNNIDNNFLKLFSNYSIEHITKVIKKLDDNYLKVKDYINLEKEELLKHEKKARKEFFDSFVNDDLIEAIKNILSLESSNKSDKLEIARQNCLLSAKGLIEILPKLNFSRDFKKLYEFFKPLSVLKSPGRVGSKDNWSLEDKVKLQNAIKLLLLSSRKLVEKAFLDDYVLEEASHIKYLFFKFFNVFYSKFKAYKKDNNFLDFQDIEILTEELISKYPKICEKYKKKFSLIFVDEFQDTNMAQKNIIFNLCDNLFLVGDAKQSIYRFRRADVSVFLETSKREDVKLEVLPKNYRSSKAVIKHVNTCFNKVFNAMVPDKKCFDPSYLDVECAKEEIKGEVSILNLISNLKNNKIIPIGVRNLIEDKIKEGLAYKDIAILCQTSNYIEIVAKELKKNKIPVSIIGRTNKKDIIKRFLALVSFVKNPYCNTSFYEVTRLPYFYIYDEVLFSIRKEYEYFWDFVLTYDFDKNNLKIDSYDLDSFKKLKNMFFKLQRSKTKSYFLDFVSDILKYSKFVESIKAINELDSINLEETIFDIAKVVVDASEGIDFFIELLKETTKIQVKDIGSEDTVKIMTIHESKGLEYNTVILPFLQSDSGEKEYVSISIDGRVGVKLFDEEKSFKRINSPLYEIIKEDESVEEVAEERRKFYVASTRAKNNLYLVGKFKNSSESKKSWKNWVKDVFEGDFIDYELKNEEENLNIERRILKIKLEEKNEENFFNRRLSVSSLSHFLNFNKIVDIDKSTEGSFKQGIGNAIHGALEKDNFDLVEDDFTKKILVDFKNSKVGNDILFCENKLTEYDFVTKVNENIIVGRIDRINIYNDRVDVIEYKTAVNDIYEKGYKAQVATYINFAKKKFPGKKIEGKIVYIKEKKVITFNEDLDTYLFEELDKYNNYLNNL
jgi:ATP-dependent helicase/nuclease subunit A